MVSSYLPWDETTQWNKIGDLLMRAKDYLGASEAFRKVVSFDENDPRSVAKWVKKMGKEAGEGIGDDAVDQMVEEAMQKKSKSQEDSTE